MRTILAAALTLLAAPAAAQTAPGPVLMMMAGAQDPAQILPAFDVVPNEGVGSFSFATPLGILTHGQVYAYTVFFGDWTYTGTCTSSYELTQVVNGKTKKLLSGQYSSTDCAPGNIFAFAAYGKAVPNSPGAATLTGIVGYGATKVKLAVPVVIQ